MRTILLIFLLTSSRLLFAQELSQLTEKVLVYEAVFILPNGDTLTKELIELEFTSAPWAVKSQQELKINYFTDTVAIKNFINPFEKRRKKYEKYQQKREEGKRGWENWTWLEKSEKTGYILTDTSLWTHPPRGNQYLYNELAGMPQIIFNQLFVGGSWKEGISIMMGWHDFKGVLESEYLVKGKTAYKRKEIDIAETWDIYVAHHHSELGEYHSKILFDYNKYGFIQFDNSFPDGHRMVTSLIQVKAKP